MNTNVLVANPTPTKLIFFDCTKKDPESNNFKRCHIDFEEDANISAFALQGNSLVVNINETVTLWRVNLETDDPCPVKTRHVMHDVKMCRMEALHNFQGQPCAVIS